MAFIMRSICWQRDTHKLMADRVQGCALCNNKAGSAEWRVRWHSISFKAPQESDIAAADTRDVSSFTDAWTAQDFQSQDANFFNLGFSWVFSASFVGCTLMHIKGFSYDNYNAISVHLLCSSEMSVSSFLPQGWLQVVWNRAPAPAQPIGHGCPAQVKKEMFSCRDVAAEKVLQPWGRREAGAWQESWQVSQAWRHWSPSWLSQPLTDSPSLLPQAISRPV